MAVERTAQMVIGGAVVWSLEVNLLMAFGVLNMNGSDFIVEMNKQMVV